MLAGLPTAFFLLAGSSVAIMCWSAYYLAADKANSRGLARVGLVLGASGLFITVMYYMTMLAVVMVIVLPIALIAFWWNGLF